MSFFVVDIFMLIIAYFVKLCTLWPGICVDSCEWVNAQQHAISNQTDKNNNGSQFSHYKACFIYLLEAFRGIL